MDSTIKKLSSSGASGSLGAGRLASGLGWFSLALGLADLLAPRRTALAMGIRPRPLLFRLIGLRELASGLGILTYRSKSRAGWLWSRVGGDAVDLALMGTALTQFGTRRNRLGVAIGAVAGITVLDTIGALLNMESKPVHVIKSITVNREANELYQAWRDLTNLPHFMNNIESVTPLDDIHSHWMAKSPAGTPVEWESEIVEDIPNEKIAWRTTEEADVAHSGSVQFKPASGGRGTVVQVTLDYTPPAGRLGTIGSKIASMFGRAPEQQMEADLHRFEQWIETGHVTTTEGQPMGAPKSMVGTLEHSVKLP